MDYEEGLKQVFADMHPESQAYDLGHRLAIRQSLRALVTQAEEQARRSGQTARQDCAVPEDWENHARDLAVWKALQAVCSLN